MATRRLVRATPRRTPSQTGLEDLVTQAESAARMLRLLSNRRRLIILCFLLVNGEMNVGRLARMVGLSQSALSQHLSLLREHSIVRFRRDARTLLYSLNDKRAARIIRLLKNIYCKDLG